MSKKRVEQTDVSKLLAFIQNKGRGPVTDNKPKQPVAQPSGKSSEPTGGARTTTIAAQARIASHNPGAVQDAASLISRAKDLIAEMQSSSRPPENVVLGVGNDLSRTPTLEAAYTNGLLFCAALEKDILNPTNASSRVTLNNVFENLVRPCEQVNSTNSELIQQMGDLAYVLGSLILQKLFPLPNKYNFDYMIHDLREIPGQEANALYLMLQAADHLDLYSLTPRTIQTTLVCAARNQVDLKTDTSHPQKVVNVVSSQLRGQEKLKRESVDLIAQYLKNEGFPAHADADFRPSGGRLRLRLLRDADRHPEKLEDHRDGDQGAGRFAQLHV